MRLRQIAEDTTRRDFLKKSAGTAATIGTGNPLAGAATTAAGGALSDALGGMSDEELLRTKEMNWIHLISPQRMARLYKKDPQYFQRELAAKLSKAAIYGFIREQCGPVFQILAKHAKRLGLDPAKAIANSAKEFPHAWAYTDSGGKDIGVEMMKKAKEFGVELPREILINARREVSRQEQEAKIRKKKDDTERGRIVPWKPDPAGHAIHPSDEQEYFEHKLNKVLELI